MNSAKTMTTAEKRNAVSTTTSSARGVSQVPTITFTDNVNRTGQRGSPVAVFTAAPAPVDLSASGTTLAVVILPPNVTLNVTPSASSPLGIPTMSIVAHRPTPRVPTTPTVQ